MNIPKEAGITVMVTIVKEDENGNRMAFTVFGEEAEKWGKEIEKQGMLSYLHGNKFPELNWEETLITIELAKPL